MSEKGERTRECTFPLGEADPGEPRHCSGVEAWQDALGEHPCGRTDGDGEVFATHPTLVG